MFAALFFFACCLSTQFVVLIPQCFLLVFIVLTRFISVVSQIQIQIFASIIKLFPGAIYVVDELDFETKQAYNLAIRATDSVSGVFAEVPLSVAVTGKINV